MTVTVPWEDSFSMGCGVSRLSGTSKGCAFDAERLRASQARSTNEQIGRPRAADFSLQLLSDAEGYSKAVRLSGFGGIRVKGATTAAARLSLLKETTSHRASLSVYGRKYWTSDPVMRLKPEALPHFSETARQCLANKGVMASSCALCRRQRKVNTGCCIALTVVHFDFSTTLLNKH